MKACFLYSIPVLLAAVVLLPSAAKADPLFTNLGAGGTYDGSNGNPVGNDSSSPSDGFNYAQGDAFQVSSTGLFGDIQIALSCFSSCTDPFTVTLNQDNGDAPGTVIESFTGASSLLGTTGVNDALVEFNSLLNPTLTVGTTYWITVSTDLNDNINFAENITGDSSDTAISTDGGASYYSPSYGTPGAFQIDSAAQSISATPEPDSILLLVSGLPLLAFARRFASRANAS